MKQTLRRLGPDSECVCMRAGGGGVKMGDYCFE